MPDLEAIRARMEKRYWPLNTSLIWDAQALLSEVERLRAALEDAAYCIPWTKAQTVARKALEPPVEGVPEQEGSE